MVGTSLDGQGGIATVQKGYLEVGFFERNNVIPVVTHSSKYQNRKIAASLLFFCSLAKIIFHLIFSNVSIVHIHMASRGSYARKSFIVRLVKLFNKKALLHLHGAEFREFYSDECSDKKKGHIRKTFMMADTVIVLSTQWVSWLLNEISESVNTKLIHNGVIPLPTNRQVVPGMILFLGRLGERKGTQDLIRAFKIVKDKIPNASLKLGGDGDIARYRRLVSELGLTESIEFLGWVSGKDKENLLAKADIYCLPSYNEGFPMGILEAMSAKVPVVASTAGGIPDAITHEQSGMLSEPGDIETLAENLVDIIQDRDKNIALSEAAHLRFKANFSLDVIISKLESIYIDLNGNKHD